ncbi:MAG: hypothetical protein L0Z50_23400 [Verrucomicrobiales bacterium]|nr:hypothetical protein [Verrucomicrobiales bacterium]
MSSLIERFVRRFRQRQSDGVGGGSGPQSSDAIKLDEPDPAKAGVAPSGLPGPKLRRSWFGVRPGRDKSSAGGSPLVQPELELENVRVVRNDLSEADLRIVTGSRPHDRSSAKAQPIETDLPRVSDPRLVWNRLTARLFVAGRSRLE